jgi:hypothetical protein
MAQPNRKPLNEFLAIKCALKGHFKVDNKEVCKNEKPWVLPPLNDRLKPASSA